MNQFTHPVGRRSATLTGYVQQTSSALPNLNVCPAVLICPGGGYAYCTDREAEPVALAFLNVGYNAFVLRYTVSTSCPGAEVFDNALAEAEESLIYLHDHAEELHIDPDKIAVLGFSAGAHLTGALGTMGRIRPAALLLGYGVYAADGVAMGVQMPNVLNHIDAQTPPSFLFATQGDRLVPASNSLDFASRLAALHTPYESTSSLTATTVLRWAPSTSPRPAAMRTRISPTGSRWPCAFWNTSSGMTSLCPSPQRLRSTAQTCGSASCWMTPPAPRCWQSICRSWSNLSRPIPTAAP